MALGISGAVLAFSAFHNYSGVSLIEDIFYISDAEIASFDATTQGLAALSLLTYLGGVVAFLAWLSRSVDNAPGLGAGQPLVSPRWSIGWWFIPFANLVMPFRVVRDLNERMTESGRPIAGALVGWWWGLFLVWNLLGIAAARYEYQTEAGATAYFQVNALADLLGVVAAVLAILLVRRIQQKADIRMTQAVGPSPTAEVLVTNSPPAS